MVLMLMASTANAIEKSVSFGGHTFKADLDDNWVTTLGEMAPFNPKDIVDPYDNAQYWTGTRDFDAFNYGPKPPGGEDENSKNSGYVDLLVVKPDATLRSLKPDGEDESSFLCRAATDIFTLAGLGDGESTTTKNIDFNGRPAYLQEYETRGMSCGVIAFFLDSDTIAVMNVETSNNFGMRAWDVIDSITVE